MVTGTPGSRAPHLGVLAALVQLRPRQEGFCRDVFIEDSEDERRQGGEEEVEEDHLPVVDHGGAGEPAQELVPEQQVDIALPKESVAVNVGTCGQPVISCCWEPGTGPQADLELQAPHL